MNKILLLLLLVLQFNLLANENLPLWIKKDPDYKGIYFRDVSTWYVTDDARTRGLAEQDALKKAYSLVSEYFGINITSITDLKESGTFTQMKNNIKTKTNQLIFNLKPQKRFIEYTKDRENFREHILILLDKVTEAKINHEMQKDQREYQALKTQVLQLMNEKKYFQAKNILALAKGKRSAYMDNTLSSIEKRLQHLINGTLLVNLTLNKKTYKPEETINLEASLNKDSYLYLFYVTGADVEMLYPNKFHRSAFIKKEKTVLFPNEDIDSLIAYKEDVNKKVSFYAIASQKNLALKSYASDQIDGVYIYDKEGKYIKIIQKCLDDATCTKHKVDFSISNHLNAHLATIKIMTDYAIKSTLIKYFINKGIQLKDSQNEILFKIKKVSQYSQTLGIQIVNFTINASLYKNGKFLSKREAISNEDDLADTLFDIYQDFEDL